jgi:hypothetical protein
MGWIIALALLALTGCANDGKREAACRATDWRAVGFEDGARGIAPEAFGEHRSACDDFGVTARLDDYLEGHEVGLERFCQPQNARWLGESGYRYTGICPLDLEAAFLEAYEQGYGLHEHWQRVENIRYRLDRKRARSREIERLVVDKTARLVSPAVPAAARANLAVEIKQLGEERMRLSGEIAGLEHDLTHAEHEYEHYRSAVAKLSVD